MPHNLHTLRLKHTLIAQTQDRQIPKKLLSKEYFSGNLFRNKLSTIDSLKMKQKKTFSDDYYMLISMRFIFWLILFFTNDSAYFRVRHKELTDRKSLLRTIVCAHIAFFGCECEQAAAVCQRSGGTSGEKKMNKPNKTGFSAGVNFLTCAGDK